MDMEGTDLDSAVRLLQEVVLEPDEAARLTQTVMAVNGQVLAVVRERLAFDDEPSGYELAIRRATAP